MSTSPTISIVLCTYNNADSLSLTLEQLLSQAVDDSNNFEIIVVNNNSSDHTEKVCLSAIKKSNISMHYLFEDRQGLSHARNTGVAKALGNYILFTDDDAELPNNWLSAYYDHIKEYEPDCLYSSIHVLWDQPKPWWYQNSYRACFVELNYGDNPLHIKDIHHEFFGKNFCVRKPLILSQGGFDPSLGRMGSKLIAGEETLLYRNLIRSQSKVLYFPHAPVGHRLKTKEYTEAHIKKLFIDGAYSSIHIARVSKNKKIFGRPIGVLASSLGVFFKSTFNFIIHALDGNKPQRFYNALCIRKSLMTMFLWIKA
ncbi:hypothetical protein GCM10011613_28660 [Cellvibrio zantedeschiae]|uniref:Glycosyltransferase 2-like domain-containing protein n=2 Tax=Cellvibrio zantedeschiae TaxID=1237077 RepID=A0ABQ3B7F4_9GAMM|nr:hypothetical protein GCM10011613_28660 [Cellvibrio zantedeschiae]